MLVPRGVNCHHPHHRFAGVMRARRSQTRQLVTGGAWCRLADCNGSCDDPGEDRIDARYHELGRTSCPDYSDR